MKKLLLATHNRGKQAELAELLAPLALEVISAGELGLPVPEETGRSFRENAAIKARAACEATGLPSLADDSGLSIQVLGGAPGVYTADWAGLSRDYGVAFARIASELAAAGSADPHPAASFLCVLALALPGKEPVYFEGRVDGRLALPPRGDGGFGYDPVFMPTGYDQTFAELPASVKQSLSHRARALAQLREFFEQKVA